MSTMTAFFIPIVDHSHSLLWVISWTRWTSWFLSVFIFLRLFIVLLPRLTPNHIYIYICCWYCIIIFLIHKCIIIQLASYIIYIEIMILACYIMFLYLLLDLDFFSRYSGCSSYIYLNRLFLNFYDIFFKCI
jgi:hypothetical protein